MNKLINILLIEDDSLDQMDVKRTLDKKGIYHKMTIALNGEQAIEHLQSNTQVPDIILLDLNMPKMNGLEFLRFLKSNDKLKDIKVFILTTSDEKEDKTAAMQFGVSGYITKPLKLESLSSLDAFNLMIDLMNMKA